MKTIKPLAVAMFFMVLGACSDKSVEPEVESSGAVESNILVRVNNEPITQFQLDQALSEALGDSVQALLGHEVRDKVLQSLVQSRAMAQQAEKEMNLKGKALLDEKVRAYREELLVKRLLKDHSSPQPVSNKMVEDYYKAHQELFGKETIKTFEYVSSVGPLADLDRDNIKKAFLSFLLDSNWQEKIENLKIQGQPVKYKKAELKASLLPAELRQLVIDAKPGDDAQLRNGSNVIMLRVVSEKEIQAKPLAAVSTGIRQTLAHKQLKKSVKKLVKNVLAETEVEYVEVAGNSSQ